MPELLPRLTAALDGHYRIERELGQGGMATVFLALDQRHQRRVAIKVFSPELSAILGQERFLKEIEVTASLQHPQILPLFDSGAADGLLYYVMPYVEGETLRARLERERQLPIADAVRIASDLADGLEYAHRRGVVHRDIKPENILLHEGRPLIADFGIALAVQEAGGTRMTQTGMSVGTPHYMAPEQAMGEKLIDHRADLFSLGALTYEMIAGDPPFTGPTMQAIVAKVLTSDPTPLAALRRAVPTHVAAIVTQALEKLPADRPQSAAAFATALRSVSADAAPLPQHAPSRSRVGLAWGGGAALLLAGLLGGRYLAADGPVATRAETRFLVGATDSVELQAVCCGQMFALSPDGSVLIFQGRSRQQVDSSGTDMELYARNMSDLRVRALPATVGAASLSFSPDGKELAFVVRQQLVRYQLATGTASPVMALPPGFVGGTTWVSPDSVAVAVGSSLLLVDMARRSSSALFAADSASMQVTGPEWLAESRALLFNFANLDTPPVVHWVPLNGGKAHRVVDGASPHYVPAWKRLLVLQGITLVAFPFDPVTGDTTGPAVPITQGVAGRSPVQAHAEYAVAPNGTLAVARRRGDVFSGTIQLVDGGRDTVIALVQRGALGSSRFSPDGRQISYFLGDVRMQAGDLSRVIYTWDIERRVSQRASSSPNSREARWSPSGDSLIFLVGGEGRFAIRAADGSGTDRAFLQTKEWSVRQFSWAAPWVVVSGLSKPGSSLDIGVVHQDSGGVPRPYLTTPSDELDPELSPDGRWLAFTSNETGAEEVYVSPFPVPSARYRISSEGGRQPRWGAGGNTLYYASPSTIYAVPFSAVSGRPELGPQRVVYRRPYMRTWDITKDGRRMVFIDTVRLLELLGIEVILGLDPAVGAGTP